MPACSWRAWTRAPAEDSFQALTTSLCCRRPEPCSVIPSYHCLSRVHTHSTLFPCPTHTRSLPAVRARRMHAAPPPSEPCGGACAPSSAAPPRSLWCTATWCPLWLSTTPDLLRPTLRRLVRRRPLGRLGLAACLPVARRERRTRARVQRLPLGGSCAAATAGQALPRPLRCSSAALWWVI